MTCIFALIIWIYSYATIEFYSIINWCGLVTLELYFLCHRSKSNCFTRDNAKSALIFC